MPDRAAGPACYAGTVVSAAAIYSPSAVDDLHDAFAPAAHMPATAIDAAVAIPGSTPCRLDETPDMGLLLIGDVTALHDGDASLVGGAADRFGRQCGGGQSGWKSSRSRNSDD